MRILFFTIRFSLFTRLFQDNSRVSNPFADEKQTPNDKATGEMWAEITGKTQTLEEYQEYQRKQKTQSLDLDLDKEL